MSPSLSLLILLILSTGYWHRWPLIPCMFHLCWLLWHPFISILLPPSRSTSPQSSLGVQMLMVSSFVRTISLCLYYSQLTSLVFLHLSGMTHYCVRIHQDISQNHSLIHKALSYKHLQMIYFFKSTHLRVTIIRMSHELICISIVWACLWGERNLS